MIGSAFSIHSVWVKLGPHMPSLSQVGFFATSSGGGYVCGVVMSK